LLSFPDTLRNAIRSVIFCWVKILQRIKEVPFQHTKTLVKIENGDISIKKKKPKAMASRRRYSNQCKI